MRQLQNSMMNYVIIIKLKDCWYIDDHINIFLSPHLSLSLSVQHAISPWTEFQYYLFSAAFTTAI